MTTATTTTATIAQGEVRGRLQGGIRSFRGIPYAAPPFGDLRFAAPAPPSHWTGIRDAIEFGPTAPKPGYRPPMDALLPDPVVPGDGCLNLNVWTPSGAAALPVLVWIHGGAFVNGSSAVSLYDGSRFARDGIVFATINYRLGVEGFGLVDGAVPNRGLLDQVAALAWIRDNISVFGGDPDRVTVAGESAGAMSVAALLAMPRAAGLFHRAILQSGAGHHVLTPRTAAAVIAEVARQGGVEPTAGGLGSLSPGELVAAQAAVSADIAANPNPARWAEITVNGMAFEPVVEPDVLPTRPIDALTAGSSRHVDVLIGSNTDEHALFLVPTGFAAACDDRLLRLVLGQFGADVDTLLQVYRAGHPDADPGQLLIAAYSDWFFRIPAIRVAEARAALGLTTHCYEFAWQSPRFGGRLAACHALEIGFTFDNLDDPHGHPMAGEAAPQHLADEMHRSWVAFVRDGDPGWPAYGPGRTVMSFDENSALVEDPRRAEREVWTGIR